MRGLSLLLAVAVGGCAASDSAAPSLSRRAAEAIDPRVPVAQAPVSTEVSAGLAERLQSLIAQARSGNEGFRSAAAGAERLAAAAGAPQSESWVVAQQTLSAAVAARATVTRALGEVNALAAERIQTLGGIGAADLQAISAAAAEVAEIDSRQAATIERIQARLAR